MGKEKKNTTDHVFCNTDPEARVKILVPPQQSRETRTAQTTEQAIFFSWLSFYAALGLPLEEAFFFYLQMG